MVIRITPQARVGHLALLSAKSYLKYLWHISISSAGLLLLGAGSPESPIAAFKGGFGQDIGQTAKLVVHSPIQSTRKLNPVLDSETALQESVPKTSSQVIAQGTQISLNGRALSVAWRRWQIGTNPPQYRIGISDTGLMQAFGVDLLNTQDATRQPIEWFSQPTTSINSLSAFLTSSFRYLDVTDLAKAYAWQMSVDGQTLRVTSTPAQVKNIRTGQQPWGERIVLDLDRATPWQMRQQDRDWVVTLDAATDTSILQRFNPQPTSFTLDSSSNQTTLRLKVPETLSPRIFTIANPNRLVIDVKPDPLIERDILWSPGLRWRQQYVSLQGASRFPVVWLEVNLRQPGLAVKPIWSIPNVEALNSMSLQGTAPLLKTALIWQTAAAINGGFFNRNEQLPLGAIRRDGQWLSSPILNRGAIAWNNSGQVKMGRLSLQETLVTPDGKGLPIVSLNSGYVQAGIARYTPEWGKTYTPLIDGEILIVVRNNQVAAQMPGGSLGKSAFPIPSDGYLLALRDNASAASLLAVGTNLRINSVTFPDDFSRYPNVLGAGPLLVQNRQIVLEAKAEKFSSAFIEETAARSAVGTTGSGNLIVVTVHNRVGGRGPTLAEMAGLMQQLGAVDALNLDGGSSTTLYLGGQILDRSPSSAARVHNGLGIFLQPSP